MSYVDLHLHLLPGVDDGARDLAQSLEHAERMVRDGVREATVTPHVGPIWPLAVAAIAARTAQLQRAIDERGLDLTLHAGAEIHARHAGRLADAELDLVAQGPPGARWILFEVPFEGIDTAFAGACAELRARGFGVVIAHPERAAGLLDGGLRLLEPALGAGAALQVNVCSLLGRHGAEAQRAGEWLLRRGLARVLASDGHPAGRRQTLADGVTAATAAGLSAAQARRLVDANPRLLLRRGLPAGANRPLARRRRPRRAAQPASVS